MRWPIVLLFCIGTVLLGGCDAVMPDYDASARLGKPSHTLPRQKTLPPKPVVHSIQYVVTDTAYERWRRHEPGLVGATIGYTDRAGQVQLNDAGLPWTTTVLLPAGTNVRLSVLFSSTRGPLSVRIYQDGRLVASVTATHGAGSASVSAMIE